MGTDYMKRKINMVIKGCRVMGSIDWLGPR